MGLPEIVPTSTGTQFPTAAELKRTAVDLISTRTYEDLITYAEFENAMRVNPQTNGRGRKAVIAASRVVLREQNKKIVNVRDVGYRIIRPNEQAAQSRVEGASARRRLRRQLETVTHVALERLTPAETAEALMEQARAAIQYGFCRRISRARRLPPRDEMKLPSGAKLIEMMKAKPK